VNRRLPVPWWKRPQFWRYEPHPQGEPGVWCPAEAMWGIFAHLGSSTRLHHLVGPSPDEPAEYAPKR